MASETPPEAPRARIASAVPGRLRLRLPAHRGDADFFTLLAQQALMLPGVTGAAGNPETAGLLLRYRGDLATVIDAAARERLFEVAPHAAAGGAARPAQLAAVAGAGLGLLALLQLGRGAVLPPAVTLLWYAAHLLQNGFDTIEE